MINDASSGPRHTSNQQQTPPHYADFGDGPVPVYPASGMTTAKVDTDAGMCGVAIVARTDEFAISCTVEPEHARAIAASLVKLAEQVERDAAQLAAAAIEKARGK